MTIPRTEHDFDELLREAVCELGDWPKTAREVDLAIDAEGDSELSAADTDRVLAYVRERLSPRARLSAHAEVGVSSCGPDDTECQGLFGAIDRPQDRLGIVLQAFVEVSGNRSIDYTIADPQLNARLVQRCWQRNLSASACELNWLLLNARKSGRIGRNEAVVRYSVPPARLNQFLFASELALRHMQERKCGPGNSQSSVDGILCDPNLAAEFESVARRLSPGFRSVEYRWAALRLRKSLKRRTASTKADLGEFQYLGQTTNVRLSSISATPGFVWLRYGDEDVYFGACSDVRAQVDRMLEVDGARHAVIPEWLCGREYRGMEMAVSYGRELTVASLDPLKADFVQQNRPRHNLVDAMGEQLLSYG